MRQHAAAFFVFWIVLWWSWQLFVGEWSRYEWIAGAIAATVGALIGEIAVTQAAARAAFPWAIVKSTPAAIGMVLVDFVTVMKLLVTRGEGEFVRTPFEYPDDIPHRAWAMVVADYSANAYVIDISDGESLTHHMQRRKASQEPA